MKTWTLAAAFAGIGAIALAHSGATGIVKERMDLMGDVGKATKSIGLMIKGEQPYYAERVAILARQIAASGGDAMTKLFPKGSIMGPTEARPEIWTDWQRFAEMSKALSDRATALAEGAENARDGGANSPKALFAAMAETCKSCHQDFRIKK